jgi:hypothetical protein
LTAAQVNCSVNGTAAGVNGRQNTTVQIAIHTTAITLSHR